MKIQVLGSGCPTCKKLYDQTNTAVADLKLNVEVEYITDFTKIAELGIMSSPVLAIDDKAVVVGSVPDFEQSKELILESQK
ncbi:TM0996/MTH895 family glutaredoxin-like protein [Candidatus Dojkabacteria bacterium]|nr:TM0996/MTH895 family glutaredoxin-like protein [Candidatus Dojkabacteria bacterium]